MQNDLIMEYLDDLEDGCLAEASLKRIESGESTLVDWQDVKKELHESVIEKQSTVKIKGNDPVSPATQHQPPHTNHQHPKQRQRKQLPKQ